jgi:TatD DNase family protein
MNPRLYDAHNHLQDDRLAPELEAILDSLAAEGIVKMVVNGSCEADWPRVRALAERSARIIPAFGYHPWFVKERTPDWRRVLTRFLDETPAAVGEIGLDRWVRGHDLEDQAEVFIWQLRLAADRNLPVTIHCLQAWGRLLEILRAQPLPRRGFLLHSYGGSAELVGPLADLGARFSLPGYFAHERKTRQREVFRHVPIERLLIETDAPDQPLPADRVNYPLFESGSGKPINHPANLSAVYRFAAEVTGRPLDTLTAQVEENFLCLFGQSGMVERLPGH